jgi:hypothetical protein
MKAKIRKQLSFIEMPLGLNASMAAATFKGGC